MFLKSDQRKQLVEFGRIIKSATYSNDVVFVNINYSNLEPHDDKSTLRFYAIGGEFNEPVGHKIEQFEENKTTLVHNIIVILEKPLEKYKHNKWEYNKKSGIYNLRGYYRFQFMEARHYSVIKGILINIDVK